MSEAVKNCADCPLGEDMDECGCIDWNMERDPVAVPGDSCPFVRLDAANVMIAENADDYDTAIVGMVDALDQANAENQKLRAAIDEIELKAIAAANSGDPRLHAPALRQIIDVAQALEPLDNQQK